VLKVSEEAAAALREVAGEGGLRFTAEEVDGETEFQMEPVEEPAEGDEVIESGGARIFLDAAAAKVLADQVLEVEPHGDHVHFVFAPQGDGASD
jgi:Fe-S cluster assembly iron-binding protein IscA